MPKILKLIAFKNVEPVVIQIVDLNEGGRFTERQKAYDFLKSHGIKIALDGSLADNIPRNAQDISDYEHLYLTEKEIQYNGFQAVHSANMLSVSSLSTFEDLIFQHPVFGLYQQNYTASFESGCEFCYLTIVSFNQASNIQVPAIFEGPFVFDLTCLYPRKDVSRCPKVLSNIKENLFRKSVKHGDKPYQYINTPSCDHSQSFKERYFRPGIYDKLLKTKQFWDPKNVFNHCQSIGNDKENCCP